MTRLVGAELSPALVDRLSQRDLDRRLGVGLPLVTVDAEGRPHPMLASYLELRAYDSRTVGLVIQAESTSARNLADRRAATLIIVEPDAIVYAKMRALDGPMDVAEARRSAWATSCWRSNRCWRTPGRLGGRDGDHETIRYGPVPTLRSRARATLAALATPRARA
jgi:hypothetical protein